MFLLCGLGQLLVSDSELQVVYSWILYMNIYISVQNRRRNSASFSCMQCENEDFWKVCRNESCEIELVAVAVKNQLIQEIDFYELVIYVIILDFV